ncbi:hypothetical protein PHYBLDRAFT_69409 [Phycomyces blakesleeanus NRRL 1555(-)]|uniref:Uncharacterized protein n=1 Tax=Phycomyces blakesleeanus (strain ATCC 8743b / DSM 1359 / FGSC 10004 / NBRC 33097 / NRRL 1555) TaxID=763407 RepID=A0A162ZL37_PHYB8|nr:hypothetical protein PHYBLDRAFT_69409 [Phycomyces blakesleeanus NRRL 1555(-)]OAD67541.1 hypothetical protein PHYBLDRAFT_69409 [Phycomyces blakesleeanus NRRL 1555(-)]|eukprot:XP_018285581.1 hypothetical protein PHYBLDRAFT_69409 [Phycomyces blakesleeanus NRRL 1555(-)]
MLEWIALCTSWYTIKLYRNIFTMLTLTLMFMCVYMYVYVYVFMIVYHYTAVNAQEDITAHKEVLQLTIFRFYGFIKIMSDRARQKFNSRKKGDDVSRWEMTFSGWRQHFDFTGVVSNIIVDLN